MHSFFVYVYMYVCIHLYTPKYDTYYYFTLLLLLYFCFVCLKKTTKKKNYNIKKEEKKANVNERIRENISHTDTLT